MAKANSIPPPHRAIDETGNVYGKLTVISLAAERKQGKLAWICRCQCGQTATISGVNLRNGAAKSCSQRCEVTRHGQRSRGQLAVGREYQCWLAMKGRCENPAAPGFKYYGGRGIRICERWRDSFATFLAEVGPRPSPQHTLERIDNNGHYEPGNVRWATRQEQARNTRKNRWIAFRGEKKLLRDWAAVLGFHPDVLRTRLKRNWPVDRAFTTPVLHPRSC